MNKKLKAFFEQGLIKESLIGEGKFYIKESDCSLLHDFALVVSQLDIWAYENSKQLEAGQALEFAIEELVALRKYNEAIKILHAYFLIQKKENRLHDAPKDIFIDFQNIKNMLSCLFRVKNFVDIDKTIAEEVESELMQRNFLEYKLS